MTSSREKTIYDVAIIGAGASGMTAAISCARYFLRQGNNSNSYSNIDTNTYISSNSSSNSNNNSNFNINSNSNSNSNSNFNSHHTDKKANIIILERHAKSGRKLLATGNGRCNLSNENINSETLDRYFHSSQPEFYRKLLSKFTVADTIEYFESMGIMSTTLEDGKIYPYCKQAFSVVDALGNELRELGVKVMHSCEVGKITKVNQGSALTSHDKICTSTIENVSTDPEIESMNPDEDLFELICKDLQDRENPEVQTIHAKRVIVSAGGKASPSLSSDGLGYALLGSLGHSITPLHPSIVQLKTVKDINAGLDGLKWDVKISLVQAIENPTAEPSSKIKSNEIKSGKDKFTNSMSANGSSSIVLQSSSSNSENNNSSDSISKQYTPLMAIVKEETGELLFTDYGISGPVVLQLARHACAIDESKFYALIDFLPEHSIEEVLELLKKRIKSMGNRPIRRLLVGVLPFKLALAITDKIFKGTAEKPIRGITSQELANLITKIKGYPFKITGTLGWDNAQVTAGGISCNEVDAETCESLICKNLYITGEVLDVDGDCGGFNLQFAWASGYIAGESAARSINDNPKDNLMGEQS